MTFSTLKAWPEEKTDSSPLTPPLKRVSDPPEERSDSTRRSLGEPGHYGGDVVAFRRLHHVRLSGKVALKNVD